MRFKFEFLVRICISVLKNVAVMQNTVVPLREITVTRRHGGVKWNRVCVGWS